MALLNKNNDKPVIAVLGDGSWPTALVKILLENPIKIRWWVRKKENVKYIRNYGYNPDYLTGVHIPKRRVKTNWRIRRPIESSEFVLFGVPAAYINSVFEQIDPSILVGKKIITSIKGMVPEENKLVTDILHEKYGVPLENMAIISGPCHAEEVAMGKQSYLTIGSENPMLAQEVAAMFDCRFVNVTTLSDLQGIEYAAVMKNIIALACGITHGLNYGDNFQAVLVSNALQEIQKFLNAVCPAPRDLMQSAYLGDLLVTTYSQFSRNRSLGTMVGRGYTVKSAMMEMRMVAEGYYAVKSINEICKQKELELPICRAVYNIFYDFVSPKIELELLKSSLR